MGARRGERAFDAPDGTDVASTRAASPQDLLDPSAQRHTAGTTMLLIVRYVQQRAGRAGVENLLRLAGETRTAEDFENEEQWSTYGQKIALFEAAAAVLGDPNVARAVGESAVRESAGRSFKAMLRTLGSPGLVLRNVGRVAIRLSTAGIMNCERTARTSAVVTYTLHPEFIPSRHDCGYHIGLLSQVTPLFGLPPARIEHKECQVEGADRCVYKVRWSAVSRLPWKRRHQKVDLLSQQLAALTEQVDTLQLNAADLVSALSVDEMLARIAMRAGASIQAAGFLLAVRAGDGNRVSVYGEGFSRSEESSLGEELLGPDPPNRDGLLVVDVASARRWYGRLAVVDPSGQGFLEAEQAMLATYARHAATALDATAAILDAHAQRQIAHDLLVLARKLAEATDMSQVTTQLADAVTGVAGADVVSVWLQPAGATAPRLEYTQTVQVTPGSPGRVVVPGPPGAGPALDLALEAGRSPELDDALVRHQTARLHTTSRDPAVQALLARLGLASAALVPIQTRGRLLGVVLAGWYDHDRDVRTDRRLRERLNGLSDHAGLALERAELLEQARHQALHDALTGLANPALLRDHYEQALARTRRNPGTHVGLVFVDLDRFKQVNDRHGHAVGDEFLRQVAARLRSSVRATDTVGRLGGDEFLVLLTDLPSAEEAPRTAEKVLARLRGPLTVRDLTLTVTASVGVSVAPDQGTDYEALLELADTSMYQAKASGRDTVRWSAPLEPA